MRVLIATHSLAEVGGVQTYERDLASWLIERGHSVVVYSTRLGEAARQFARRTIPVTDDLRSIAAPVDVIHGDSGLETMIALLQFPAAPAIFVCHGWGSLGRTTPHFPRIVRYVAVDDTCADRLLLREAIPPEKVSVLLNAVDVTAFQQRAPLPPKPRRAVAFGNAAHELTFLPVIRDACRRAAVELDVVGGFSGTEVTNPESILGHYDVAFAKAKCAIEAMACGLAVVLCDAPGVGGMVRSNDLDRLRRLNFGIRTLQKPLTAETIVEELDRYDPDDARLVSDRIRRTASSDDLHQSLLEIYENAIEQNTRAVPDPLEESRAAAAFLHQLALEHRASDGEIWRIAKTSQRALRMPIVGPLATRMLRWLTRRG
jgi:glycosyl transferase family 4